MRAIAAIIDFRPIFLSTASIGSTEDSKETTGPDKPVQPTSLDENGNSLTSDASTTKGKGFITQKLPANNFACDIS